MNAHDDRDLQTLLQRDAAKLHSQAPSQSPLLIWHQAKRRAAHRLERRLRLASGAALLLVILALAPILWQQPLTMIWLPAVGAAFWPLFRLLSR